MSNARGPVIGADGTPVTRAKQQYATQGMVTATGLATAFGGLIIPFVGWLAGIIMMWLSPMWTRAEKLIATFVPLGIVAFAIALTSLNIGQFSTPTDGMLTVVSIPNLIALLAPVSSIVLGIWLMKRAKSRLG